MAAEHPFLDQKAADEKSAKDEEYVYADPAGVARTKSENRQREDRAGRMEVDDEEDSDAAQEVELNFTTLTNRGRPHLWSLASGVQGWR